MYLSVPFDIGISLNSGGVLSRFLDIGTIRKLSNSRTGELRVFRVELLWRSRCREDWHCDFFFDLMSRHAYRRAIYLYG
jgi:hypothetical protein